MRFRGRRLDAGPRYGEDARVTDLRLTRKEFLHLSMGAAALTITGCPSDDTGGDGSTTDPTTGSPTTSPSGSGTSPTTKPSTTDDPSTGDATSTGPDTTGSTGMPDTTGEPETGSTGSGSGSGSGSSGSAADCSGGATDTVITGNHGHAVVIAAGMLVAGTPLNDIDITGAGAHSHTIDLSADDVDALLAGESVTVTSSMDSMHTHMVTVSC